jgi:hypothetical protein
MEKTNLYILFICLFASMGWAYTYEVYTYSSSKTLYTSESILFANEGGMDKLTLTINSSATIKGTSTLKEGEGGIWQIILANDSYLDMLGGEIHEIDISHNATAILKGGLIEAIYSYQIVPEPHIALYYSGTLPTVQTISGFNYLVGNWGNGEPFSIYLHDTGYDVYGNFEFILVPEPVAMLLLGLGGLLLRRRGWRGWTGGR